MGEESVIVIVSLERRVSDYDDDDFVVSIPFTLGLCSLFRRFFGFVLCCVVLWCDVVS